MKRMLEIVNWKFKKKKLANELAQGINIPRVNPPKTGPPTIPNTPKAASNTPGKYLTKNTTT